MEARIEIPGPLSRPLARAEALRIERRRYADRRARATPMLSRYSFFGGHRSRGRRDGETHNIFVDVYGQGTFLLATAIILLNALDAFFTLLFLGLGGEELNPVAQVLLDLGPMAFLWAKTAGIGVLATYLVIVRRFRGVQWGFWSVLFIYLVLLGWHLTLYSRI